METKVESREYLDRLMNEADTLIQKGKDYLVSKGVVIDLEEWVTIKEYCKRFNIKNTETVSNWVKRGIIPAEDTKVIEELNNIRLVKAKSYPVGVGQSAS